MGNTWSELHDAGDGADFGGIADYTGDTIYVAIQTGPLVDNCWYTIKRGMVFFAETADIPDGDTVTAASLFLYINSKSQSDFFLGLKLQVVPATPRTEHELTTDDFDEFGTSVLGEIVVDDIVVNAYNEIVLDPSVVNKTGTTILGLRFDKDVNNDDSYDSNSLILLQIASMDDSNPDHRPFLTTVH